MSGIRRLHAILAFVSISFAAGSSVLAQDKFTSGREGDPVAKGTLAVGPLVLTVKVSLEALQTDLLPPCQADLLQGAANSSSGVSSRANSSQNGTQRLTFEPKDPNDARILPLFAAQLRTLVLPQFPQQNTGTPGPGANTPPTAQGNTPSPAQTPGAVAPNLTPEEAAPTPPMACAAGATQAATPGATESNPVPTLTQLYTFEVSLDDNQLETLRDAHVSATMFRVDGSATDLTDAQVWQLSWDPLLAAPIALLEIKGQPDRQGNCAATFNNAPLFTDDAASVDTAAMTLFHETCKAEYVLARDNGKKDRLLVAMATEGDSHSPVLSVKKGLFDDSGSSYRVNGGDVSVERVPRVRPASDGTWTVEWQAQSDTCREFPEEEDSYATLVLRAPSSAPQGQPANGILVGTAKVFDVVSLQNMLNTTASQLASISGFSASPITAALGNFQGITRNTSFLNAQVTTAATPSVNQTSSLGVSTPNTVQTTTPSGSTTVTLQCPDGSLPALGTSSTSIGGCTTVPSASAPISGSQSTLITTPASSTVTTTTGPTTTANNGTTTTIPSVSGTVPTALTPTPLTPPSNVGVASSDILAEQVQLNSQITTLTLLLQGALSDEYLLKNSTAVGQRQQTTLGFTVALDPPRRSKRAVAEVRVIIIPAADPNGPRVTDGTTIMNLLPSEKTYNVAKVTSSQKAFGAGAVIEPISLGVNTGKSKDRLYLAKDTDTLALQFPLPGSSGNARASLLATVRNGVSSAIDFRQIRGCSGNEAYGPIENEMETKVQQEMSIGAQPIAFGWQFRPVLGADYVQGGERQVFAQLALGTALGQSYNPDVYIETLWREYNPQTQVVGRVISGTCTLARQVNGVSVLSEPVVHNVAVTDLGGGQLKLTATGSFYSPSINVLSAQNTLSAVFFDGKSLEAFGSAYNLMEGGDLKILGQNGRNSPFGIVTSPQQKQYCAIADAKARAVPRPDGNSRVVVDLTMGSKYDLDKDNDPQPLILIGAQVYGLKESPFVNDAPRCKANDVGVKCQYQFLAPTTTIRNAQTFLVRSLAWDDVQQTGRIDFFPSFTSATSLDAPPVITTQPANQAVLAGQDATFAVAASGAAPLKYQWQVNGEAIPQASSPSYTIPKATAMDNNVQYTVVVSNAAGSVTSKIATLQVEAKAPTTFPKLSITSQPTDQTVALGKEATFAVGVSLQPAAPPLRYQWKKSDAVIPGATASSYKTPKVTPADDGKQFAVTVSRRAAGGALETVTSDAATLTVGADATSSYEISGFNFSTIPTSCNDSAQTAPQPSPCVRIFVDSAPSSASTKFTAVTDNLGTVSGVRTGAKTLRLQVYWNDSSNQTGPASTIEWDLALPKADTVKADLVGTPAFLYVGDSQTVSFSNDAFKNCPTAAPGSTSTIPVAFDGGTLNGQCNPSKKTLDVSVTTAVTKTPGHKQLTPSIATPPTDTQADSGKATTNLTLGFDVIDVLKPIPR